MDMKEKEIVEVTGMSKYELKEIRDTIGDVHPVAGQLWYREKSNKPEHLRTIVWTEVGQHFLQHYLKTKTEISIQINENRVMTKSEFGNMVNDSKWVGKVVNNNYKNKNCVLVDNVSTGFKVVVHCKDNKSLNKNSYVVVDTKNQKHKVLKESIASYEKAIQVLQKLS